MTLTELIATLEVAPASSHALDTAIWAIAYKSYPVRWEDGKAPEFLVDNCYCSNRHERGASHWQNFSSGGSGPGYSQSLDAALKLLPTGALWSVCSMEHGPYAQVIRAKPGGSFIGGWHEGKAATPALALCVAALRAVSTPS